MIFVSSMLGLAMTLAQWSIAGMYADHALGISIVGFVPIMVVGFIGVGIISRAAQLAQSIGGTVTTTSGSALLAGTVGGMMGGSLSTLKMPMAAAGQAGGLISTIGRGPVGGATAAMKMIRQQLMKGER